MTWIHLPKSHFTAETAEACSRRSTYSDGEQSATSRSTGYVNQLSKPESQTATSTMRQYGTTSEPSMDAPGVASWITSLRDFRVNHTPLPAWDLEKWMSEIFGRTPFAFLEKSNQGAGFYWRTSQLSFPSIISDEYSGMWPKSFRILEGKAYRLSMSVRRIYAKDFGLWPTPTTGDARSRKMSMKAKMSGGGYHIDRSTWWQTEPAVGRVANGLARGVGQQLKPLGNGQVPRVVAEARMRLGL